jgi:hypothetical protein
MAMLPDPATSQAFLIGAAEYATLERLPAVENNLTGLQAVLTDPAIWGLPAANCTVLRQPENADTVLDTLQQIASSATDTLVVYFAGHGLIDPGNDDELYLALPGSDKERAYRTAVPYSWVRREMQAAHVRRKVVIIDCCYSGRALGRWMGDGQADLADRLEIDGTCVLTATARTRRALAPPDEHFTAFTGELIATLSDGIPDGPELLDMDTLYRHLTVRLRARSLPQPQRGQLDHGGDIALARNQAPATRSTSAPHLERDSAADLLSDPVPQPAPWRPSIDRSRPLAAHVSPQPEVDKMSGCLSSGAPLGWTAIAGLLALTQHPFWWLATAGATGLTSLIGLKSRKGIRQLSGAALAVATLAIYILIAAAFTNSALICGWIVGTTIILIFAALMVLGLTHDRDKADKLSADRERQQAMVEKVRRSRWLQDAGPDEAGSALLDPLAEIPSARFASLSQGCFPFLAVAGDRIALVAFCHWPPGTYTRRPGVAHDIRRDGQLFPAGTDELSAITAQAQQWQLLLPNAALRVVIVVQPSTSSRAGRIVLRLDDEDSISLVTLGTFAAAAGSFLVEGAYELNMPILERLLSQLNSTPRLDAEPIPATTPPPKVPAAGDRRHSPYIASSADEDHSDSAPVRLPEPSQFDSVAADAMRWAATLRRSGEALDTRMVLLAVALVHVRGRWERIWLHCSRTPEDIGRQREVLDPDDQPRESWNGIELTATCASALRAAARIGQRHDLPIAPGILALGLLADPATAAAKVLGVGITIQHGDLLHLIEDDLLGTSDVLNID